VQVSPDQTPKGRARIATELASQARGVPPTSDGHLLGDASLVAEWLAAATLDLEVNGGGANGQAGGDALVAKAKSNRGLNRQAIRFGQMAALGSHECNALRNARVVIFNFESALRPNVGGGGRLAACRKAFP